MKKFTIPCDFGDKKAPFDVYIGNPAKGNHPLFFQSAWLAETRGGSIPGEVMESFQKLLALSEKNGVSFEDLCVYALEAANSEKAEKEGAKKNKDLEKVKELKNGVQVIFKAEELKSHFDDDFVLLFVRCKNTAGNMRHAVVLTRAEHFSEMYALVIEEKVVAENLSRYGVIEHMGEGPKISKEVYARIHLKYQPPPKQSTS
ncbi:MAG: DUF2610 domain-containing protein [Phaeodactylibacter sp.]|nr:DUF2610 domain-containing protein [Phaeodactylibacter sp.]